MRIDPDEGLLFLNQEIVITFDRPIDPITVTKDTVRIVDAAGDAVGVARLKVHQFTVEIQPRVPRDPKLDDGSFRPGRSYSLVLPGFPLSNSVRGLNGELLLRSSERTWRAADHHSLPEGHPTPLVRSRMFGRFHLVRPPVVAGDGAWIELHFNRPVYPPSAVPTACVLKPSRYSSGAGSEDIPIAAVTIDPHGRPDGLRTVRLTMARPLQSGLYELYFPPGERGLRDYGLTPVLVPPTESSGTAWPDLGGHFWPVHVVRGRPPAIVVEGFQRSLPGLRDDPRSKRLGWTGVVEGALVWGPDGLRLPRLDWEGFRSLGELHPPARSLDLQPGAKREIAAGRSVELPPDVWDFDRVVIPKGHRVYIVLPRERALRLRVAGRFEVAGELVFRVTGTGAVSGAPGGPVEGDPRPTWQAVPGHVAIEVGGIARLSGRILREEGVGRAAQAAVPGYLWGRGPILGTWEGNALQAWLRPSPVTPAARPGEGPALPGTWVAHSDWYPLRRPSSFEGRVHLVDGDPSVEVHLQGREHRGERQAWGRPAGLARLGKLEAVRFLVSVRGRKATGEVLLRGLRIR